MDREIIQVEHEISGVQYHPVMDHLFISSDCAGNVLLWDTRMAYTGNNVTAKGVVERVTDFALSYSVVSQISRLVPYKAGAAVRTLSLCPRG